MDFLALAYALAVGLIIGLERGWSQRDKSEGQRFAGLRTFAITSLLGGLLPLLTHVLPETFVLVLWVAVFFSITALVVVAHLLEARQTSDFGITTELALLLTFLLGSLCAIGLVEIAVPAAVIAAFLLSLKPLLHGWLERLQQRELFAILQMLLISVVLLPLLPNEGIGPGKVINPYLVGWMVVLITGISFVGYFAIKVLGSHRGILLTGLLGGLASSTAVTLSLSRIGKVQQQGHKLLVAAILLAAGTMFPRMLLEVAVLNQEILRSLFWPLTAMMLVTYVGVFYLIRRARQGAKAVHIGIDNPFDIVTALKFAALLVVILILAHYAHEYFDALGIYAVAAISGLTDVDAITLSLAKMSGNGLSNTVAVPAILLAASVNTAVKVGLVATLGHPNMRLASGAIAGCALAAGWFIWWVQL
ncbi:MgtC/SapB family protein [Pseudidiomarina aquimaris]|uniref:MgtC/SapB family protein n=1 Tax=Pseudidiomarina aquimaris TaxID=641841 RepID=UPI003A973940